jgi:hypothetical protein
MNRECILLFNKYHKNKKDQSCLDVGDLEKTKRQLESVNPDRRKEVLKKKLPM